MKKQYSYNERIFNIINRAVKDFGYEFEVEDSLQEIWDGAEDCIRQNVDYDRIEECEFDWGGHWQHLTWTDDMGYVTDKTGEFTSGEQRDMTWLRYDEEKREFTPIEWFRADTEKDYVVVDYDIDSEGQLVCLVTK